MRVWMRVHVCPRVLVRVCVSMRVHVCPCAHVRVRDCVSMRVHVSPGSSPAGAPPTNSPPPPPEVFSDREAQAHTVRLTCAFGQLVVLAACWPRGVCPAGLGDELGEAVARLGGHLQLLLQVSGAPGAPRGTRSPTSSCWPPVRMSPELELQDLQKRLLFGQPGTMGTVPGSSRQDPAVSELTANPATPGSWGWECHRRVDEVGGGGQRPVHVTELLGDRAGTRAQACVTAPPTLCQRRGNVLLMLSHSRWHFAKETYLFSVYLYQVRSGVAVRAKLLG